MKTSLFKSLYFQVLTAIAIGILLGHFYPEIGEQMKPLGDAFVKLIKMVIAPVIFCTVVTGIAGMESMKAVGRTGAVALLYFEIVSTIALIIGLIIVNVVQPGAGMNVDPATLDAKAVAIYAEQAKDQGIVGFLMDIIPGSVIGAFASGNILQVLLFAVMFGFALHRLGSKGQLIFNVIESFSQVIFGIINMIMRLAPIGAFGAMAFTIGAYGVGSLVQLGQLMICFYITCVLFVLIVLAVVLFRSSSNLAAAYGIAVTLDMLITTTLTFFVIRYGWRYPLALCIAATGFFFAIDVTFFASNLLKLFEGGWFPILIGGAIFTLMTTWKDGRELLNQRLRDVSIDLQSFLESVFISPPARVAGTAVFMAAQPGIVPNALMHNLKHNKVLHRQNLFVTVRNHEVPWIGRDKRLQVEPLGHDCWQVVVQYGFKDDPDIPSALHQLRVQGCDVEPMTTSYFLSRDTIIPTIGSGMAPWREKLFAQMHHNASGAADFLHLPSNAVVELGSKIEI